MTADGSTSDSRREGSFDLSSLMLSGFSRSSLTLSATDPGLDTSFEANGDFSSLALEALMLSATDSRRLSGFCVSSFTLSLTDAGRDFSS